MPVPPNIDFSAANGKQLGLIRKAFLVVFVRRGKLVIFLSDHFGKNFDQFSEGDDLEEQIHNLLMDARAEGWLNDLVFKAIEVFARATVLKNMLDQWIMFADEPAGTQPAQHKSPVGLERASIGGDSEERDERTRHPGPSLIEEMMNDVRGPAAAQRWLERLASMRRRVCRITIPPEGAARTTEMATGFLVGPDLVLTIGRLSVGQPKSNASTTVQFDFEMIDGRSQVGRVLRARNTEVFLEGDWRPQSSEDLLREDAPVWFGLIKLEENEGSRADDRGVARGWFDLNASLTKFKPGEPLFLMHHPRGEYLHMSQGTLVQASTSTRLRFRGETDGGSSGAPLFNRHFQLAGLHEGRLNPATLGGDSDKVALRADAIAKTLQAKGRMPPPWIDPADKSKDVKE